MRPARAIALRWALLAAAALSSAPHASGAELESDAALAARILVLARAHEQGHGAAKDPDRAVRLYCKAARLGHVEAQYALGRIFAEGRAVTRDYPVAALFFMLASRQGHEGAQRALSLFGEPTSGVPGCLQDPVNRADAFPENEGTAAARLPDVEPFVAVTPAQQKALKIVNELAPAYGVMPRLAIAVIRAESNFDPAATSPKNAQGLMQLIPDTSVRFKVSKPYDPVHNVRGGLAYLRWLLAYFEGDVALVAAAYNAGERTVDRHRGIPPYPETRDYVKRVVQFFGRDDHPFDAAVTERTAAIPRDGRGGARLKARASPPHEQRETFHGFPP